jgi:hypothetical protein
MTYLSFQYSSLNNRITNIGEQKTVGISLSPSHDAEDPPNLLGLPSAWTVNAILRNACKCKNMKDVSLDATARTPAHQGLQTSGNRRCAVSAHGKGDRRAQAGDGPDAKDDDSVDKDCHTYPHRKAETLIAKRPASPINEAVDGLAAA